MTALGELANARGDAVRARELFTEALRLAEQVSDWGIQAWLLYFLGCLDVAGGDISTAVARLVTSTRLNQTLGFGNGVAFGLSALAEVAVVQAQPILAGRLLGAAERVREHRGIHLLPVHRPEHARRVALVWAQAAPEQVARWVEAGRQLAEDEALNEAVALCGDDPVVTLL